MRSKIPRQPDIPAKYIRYKPQDWPGGWQEWISERESYNASQPPVRYAGSPPGGQSWDYWAGVLGDAVDLMVARREARMLAHKEAVKHE